MSDPEPSLSHPASVAVELQISGGTFVLAHNNLYSEGIIRSVQDDTAGVIAVFVGTTRNSFQGMSHSSSVYPVFRFISGPRSGRDTFGIPSVQQTGRKDDVGYFLSPHANATRSKHANYPSFEFPQCSITRYTIDWESYQSEKRRSSSRSLSLIRRNLSWLVNAS